MEVISRLHALGIVSKVNMVFLAICIGIAQGAQPIWGFNYGAKKYDRVRQAYRYSATACTIIATFFFLCFQIFPHQIIRHVWRRKRSVL